MANYIAKFESTAIQIKDSEEFVKTMSVLGFVADGTSNCDEKLYNLWDNGEKHYAAVMGHGSVPSMIYSCLNDHVCDDCPISKYIADQSDSPIGKFCDLEKNNELDIYEEVEYDLSEIIADHMVPGTKVRILEIGWEKLRYLCSYEYIIIKHEDDKVETFLCIHGVSWDDVEK